MAVLRYDNQRVKDYVECPTIAAIDANGCLGHVASTYAVKIAKELARKYGTSSAPQKIGVYSPLERVLEDMYSTMKDIRRAGKGRIFHPGEIEGRVRAKSLQQGIPFTLKQIDKLNELGSEVGMERLNPILR